MIINNETEFCDVEKFMLDFSERFAKVCNLMEWTWRNERPDASTIYHQVKRLFIECRNEVTRGTGIFHSCSCGRITVQWNPFLSRYEFVVEL